MTPGRLRWEAARAARAIGVPGWAALALLLVVAALVLADLLPTAHEADRLEAQARALSARPRLPAGADAPPDTAAQQLARFQQRLDDAAGIGRSLSRLHAAAARQGLQLPQGDFKLVTAAAEPVARYTMDLTLTADYRALRRFVREALREQPALALESMGLQRAESQPGQVDARLRLVLFLRPPRADLS